MEAMRWAGYYGRPAYCGYRTEDRLYVRYANGQEELYDYTRDPYELDNLANDPAYAAEKDALKRQTRQACSPTPPGFAWDEQPTRLRPPSQVTATWETPKSVVVTWRAPSGVERSSRRTASTSVARLVVAPRASGSRSASTRACGAGSPCPRTARTPA